MVIPTENEICASEKKCAGHENWFDFVFGCCGFVRNSRMDVVQRFITKCGVFSIVSRFYITRKLWPLSLHFQCDTHTQTSTHRNNSTHSHRYGEREKDDDDERRRRRRKRSSKKKGKRRRKEQQPRNKDVGITMWLCASTAIEPRSDIHTRIHGATVNSGLCTIFQLCAVVKTTVYIHVSECSCVFMCCNLCPLFVIKLHITFSRA